MEYAYLGTANDETVYEVLFSQEMSQFSEAFDRAAFEDSKDPPEDTREEPFSEAELSELCPIAAK